MRKRILIVGAGFAGMWSALAAARLLDQERMDPATIEVALVAPKAMLPVRPRFYEPDPARMAVSLRPLFDATGVRFVQGIVETIDTAANTVEIAHSDGTRSTLAYDSLVLAAGSRLFRPAIPGLRDYGFSIDQLDEAEELWAHCHSLAQMPATMARDTAVVAGGGFTGIEIAAELPARLRGILGRQPGRAGYHRREGARYRS